jgi:hypothetical protein
MIPEMPFPHDAAVRGPARLDFEDHLRPDSRLWR